MWMLKEELLVYISHKRKKGMLNRQRGESFTKSLTYEKKLGK